MTMRRFGGALAILLVFAFAPGCFAKQKRVERELKANPAVDCSTGQGDLRMLQHDKAHVIQRIAAGVTAIYPAGLVLGLVTRTEGVKIRMAIGKYNKMIDARMAEIKQTCGIE